MIRIIASGMNKGKWTYTLGQWCFEQKDSTTIVFQEQANHSYYWGGAWHGGGRKTLSWRTRGSVALKKGFHSSKESNDGPTKKHIAEIEAELSSGQEYEVGMVYQQKGHH